MWVTAAYAGNTDTHGHPLSVAAVQEQRSSCPLVPFLHRKFSMQALDARPDAERYVHTARDLTFPIGEEPMASAVCRPHRDRTWPSRTRILPWTARTPR